MRPYIICHMMAPVDGKVENSRWTAADSVYDAQAMAAQYHAVARRLHTDAWLFGTTTVKQFFPEKFDGCACHVAYPDQLCTFVGECNSRRMMIALVPHGDVRFSGNTLRGDNIIAIVGERVSADYLEFLEEMQISYVFAGRDGTDLTKAMHALQHDFGLQSISLQGGGITNGSFFAAGLVDELSIVVSPQLDGRTGAPSIIDYRGKETGWTHGFSLRLLDVERLAEGCVWLHYQVRRNGELVYNNVKA